MALAGLRPVVEMRVVDFALCGMDEMVNQAAKNRFMFGGQGRVPMVVRMPIGIWDASAAQHSQSFESWFACFSASSPENVTARIIQGPLRSDNLYALLGSASGRDSGISRSHGAATAAGNQTIPAGKQTSATANTARIDILAPKPAQVGSARRRLFIATKSIDVKNDCSIGEPDLCDAIGMRGPPAGERE